MKKEVLYDADIMVCPKTDFCPEMIWEISFGAVVVVVPMFWSVLVVFAVDGLFARQRSARRSS